MADNLDQGIFNVAVEIIKYTGGVALLAGGWFMKRLVSRVDYLEKNTVSIAIFNDTIGSFRKDLEVHNKNVLDEIRSTRDRVDKLMDRK